MNQVDKKYFGDPQGGRLNADDSPFSITTNEWINAENVRTGSTDRGFTGIVESIGGNSLIPSQSPIISDNYMITIGSVEDVENNRIVYFNYDDNQNRRLDQIICIYPQTGDQYLIINSNQVGGGLNFSKTSLIHSAKIAGNILSFPDGTNNEPRKINIESGIKANHPSFVTNEKAYAYPLDFSQITLIKKPPIFTPLIDKIYDSTFPDNLISNYGFTFSFQYQYYDGEVTVPSSYSINSLLDTPTENKNCIVVKMSFSEKIPSTVKIINLIVREGNGIPTGSTYAHIIRVWDKDNPLDLTKIIDHNNQTTQLTYSFYNNISGETIAADDTLRAFDNVPIYSQTHEVSKGRYFLANNIEGYATPPYTSLNASIGNPIPLSQDYINVPAWGLKWGDFDLYSKWSISGVFLYISFGSNPGYYLVTSTLLYDTSTANANPPQSYSPSGALSFADLTFAGATLNIVKAYLWVTYLNLQPPQNYNGNIYPGDGNNTTDLVTYGNVSFYNPTSNYYNVMPQLSRYKLGVVFYDYAMRKCGVCINPNGTNIEINTPARDYNYTSAYDYINWTLNNQNALTEIPKWAYYYSVVKTLNLRTRFFVQSIAVNPEYVLINNTGKEEFKNTYSNQVLYLKLDLTALSGSGLGYTFSEGDICIITDASNNTRELSVVLAKDGNVYVKPYDYGNLSGVKLAYELYTPYKEQIREPYYEMGSIFPVINPGTINREYGQLNGILRPDSWVFKRYFDGNIYNSCAMSPNDLFYKKWETDAGKVDAVTNLGQTEKSTNIAWSDTYILGTQVTGSSTFRFGNETYVPDECGGINKLQLTSKVKDSGQGNVMLGLCSAETVSMYLGETQITDSTGKTQFFGANASQVISTINTLKGNYGCLNPESVSQYRGHVYFLDVSNGRVVQYSDNGLDSISLYKMSRFWKNWCKAYLAAGGSGSSQISSIPGQRPYIFTVVDPNHDELLISLPQLPNGLIPPSSTPSDFDILSNQGKTIVFKLGTGAVVLPHWQSAYTFNTENFVTLQNGLYSFKNGSIYVHNQNNNTFYGTSNFFFSKIMFTSNILPQIPKVYNNFVSESNIIPNYVYFYNDFPITQWSDLESTDFVNKEGIWYANILRDRATPDVAYPLLQGDVMRNTNMYVLVSYLPSSPLQLKLLQLGTSISRGHTV